LGIGDSAFQTHLYGYIWVAFKIYVPVASLLKNIQVCLWHRNGLFEKQAIERDDKKDFSSKSLHEETKDHI